MSEALAVPLHEYQPNVVERPKLKLAPIEIGASALAGAVVIEAPEEIPPALTDTDIVRLDFEARRSGRKEIGALGIPMLFDEQFTMAEAERLHQTGISVPMDLVPSEYWWGANDPFPRFSAEALGADF
jgi:hypothetical protein